MISEIAGHRQTFLVCGLSLLDIPLFLKNYAQLCEQRADTLLIIPLASQCQALLEIGLSLGIVAQTLLDLPQIQQCSNESFFIIKLNSGIICTLQVVFSQAIEASQDKEWGKGAGSRNQLGLFALIEGDL
jgi:hypothetical protein